MTLSRSDRIVAALSLVALLSISAMTWMDIREVRKGKLSMQPGHSMSTVVQTSEGPTTVQTSGDDLGALALSHQDAIDRAKGL